MRELRGRESNVSEFAFITREARDALERNRAECNYSKYEHLSARLLSHDTITNVRCHAAGAITRPPLTGPTCETLSGDSALRL